MPRPSKCSSGAVWRTPNHNSTPSVTASISACRNNGPIPAREPAPSRCATDGGNAIIIPIAATSASIHTLAPTATAASVCAL